MPNKLPQATARLPSCSMLHALAAPCMGSIVRHLGMQNHTMIMTAVLAILLVACAGEWVIGKLGKAVGSELTIEGAFQGGGDVLVARVNGKKLAAPILVTASNLAPPRYGIPTNTLCRFRGKEVVLEVGDRSVDPDTGLPLAQPSASVPRRFRFEVAEVIAPKEMKTEARVIMTGGVQKMGAVEARFEILQDSATQFSLRLEVGAFVDARTFPREVKVEAYSRECVRGGEARERRRALQPLSVGGAGRECGA